MGARRVLAFALCAAVLAATHRIASAHPGHDDPNPSRDGSAKSSAKPEVSVTTKDGYRYINANGIPDHATGAFPNRNNPNTISPQRYAFRVTLQPKASERPTSIRGSLFGVALNGVPFDPGTAEFWGNDRRLGWNYEAIGSPINLGLDENRAHVQPSGAYHYHGIPTGLAVQLKKWG